MAEKRPWTPAEDDLLCDMVADGIKFRDIGLKLGRTKNSCIGRMHRLADKLEAEREAVIKVAREEISRHAVNL